MELFAIFSTLCNSASIKDTYNEGYVHASHQYYLKNHDTNLLASDSVDATILPNSMYRREPTLEFK